MEFFFFACSEKSSRKGSELGFLSSSGVCYILLAFVQILQGPLQGIFTLIWRKTKRLAIGADSQRSL